MEVAMEMGEVSGGNSNSSYTYKVSFNFDMQFTFAASEVHPIREGGVNELQPAEEVLVDLLEEVRDYLSERYAICDIDATADFDALLGVTK